MCGRFSITSPPEAMRQLLGFVGNLPNLPPRYNVAPTQMVPVVRIEAGERCLRIIRWGLVPHWADRPAVRPLINARGETVSSSPAFRQAFRRRRCLVPADGFFEWQGRKKGPKQPYHIVRRDRALFAMAGIWESWQPAEGEALETFAIITCPANETVRSLHDRMPAILLPEQFAAWLDIEGTDAVAAKAMIAPAPDDLLEAYPVSTRVNAVAHDDPEVIRPLAEARPKDETPKRKAQMRLL